ncbi:hypothetical protein JW758_01640 [Candidatus Peregrinibacteria bacterium]|nr:hypothetical protein [Candidatus Peregrinibacteria bacterium]
MAKLSKTILERIKKDKIKPIPRWQFVLMHLLLWSAYLIAIVLGALAFSIIFRLISGIEWEMVRRAGKGPIRGFFLILPYLWLIILGVVLFIAGRVFEKTKKGYRFKQIIIVLSSVAISLVLGVILYFVGVGHSVENVLINRVGPYAEWRDDRDRFLVAPNEGVLVGRVIEIKPDEELLIIDFMSEKWVVDISYAVSNDNFEPQVGLPVGLIGKQIKEGEFFAERIMPFRPPRQLNVRPRIFNPIKNERNKL